MRLRNNYQLLILLLAPLVIMAPTMAGINYPPGGEYSDIAITHYPNLEFIRTTLLDHHQIPLWNPMILSGHPFAGDPLSGIFYPPLWISFLFPIIFGLNIVIYLHLVIGAVGLFLLLQRLKVRKSVCLIISIGFVLMPKLLTHYGAGHATLIFAVCLTPLLMVAESSRNLDIKGLNPRSIIIFSLIILADIRWVPFALAAWIVTLFLFMDERKKNRSDKLDRSYLIEWLVNIKKIIIECIVSMLIAAPFLFPFFEYLLRTTRIRIEGGENLIYSLPVNRLIGLIIPPEGGLSEWIIYPGMGFLFLYGLSFFSKSRKVILLSVGFAICLLWSLGDQIPIVAFLSSLPGLNLIRVPPRIMFLGEIILLISGGLTTEAILSENNKNRNLKIYNLVITSVFTFLTITSIGIVMIQGSFPSSIIQMVSFAIIFFLFMGLLINKKNHILPILLLGCAITGDLLLTGSKLFSINTSEDNEKLLFFDSSQKSQELFRVYSPDYAIPQDVAIQSNLELAQGVNPMHLYEYARYMVMASGIPYDQYSVVVPPMPEKEEGSLQKNQLDSERLGMLNVRYYVGTTPIQTDENWEFIKQKDDLWIYENKDLLPRVYNVKEGKICRECNISIQEYSPNKIQITASGNGILVLSELSYPGWEARVDGKETQILRYQGIFRSIELPGGEHSILFLYHPVPVFMGLLISGIIILTMIFRSGEQP